MPDFAKALRSAMQKREWDKVSPSESTSLKLPSPSQQSHKVEMMSGIGEAHPS